MRTVNTELHPLSHLPKTIFGYDFNTGKSRTTRASQRREHSCPTKHVPYWKDIHTCPESNQRYPMRHDGEWWTTDKEDNTQVNEIKHRRSGANILELSHIRYSCDEFPPATWVEGGDNLPLNQMPSETRCAAIRCGGKGLNIKAEQDWQATAHGALQRQLKSLINQRRVQNNAFPNYNAKNSVALFGFTMNNEADGYAAKVYTYADAGFNTLLSTDTVTQAKRDLLYAVNTSQIKPWELTYQQLRDLTDLGLAYESHAVHANESFVPVPGGFTGTTVPMSWMEGGDGLHLRWTDAEEDDDMEPVSNAPSTAKSMSKRQTAPRNASTSSVAPLVKAASPSALQKARAIVEKALAESAKLNAARLAKPMRNNYSLKPGTVIGDTTVPQRLRHRADATGVTALLNITDEIADAAALVAEADATSQGMNATKRAVAAAGTYWMGSLDRKGTVPWGDNSSYVIFRNVLDYGAVGNGVTDDTKAIKLAMTDGKRCGVKCNGSTTKNAIVYFPPGTYVISSTIAMPFGTQVIGDANNRPTLRASKSFIGMGVLSTDEYTGGGTGTDGLDQEYYVNTANFYRQIRNVVIDVTATRASQKVACLHYQVAQATSLQNVDLVAGSTGYGMYAENGSGGQISDVNFKGGAVGLYGGSQQFTAQRLNFDGCAVGVQLIWDWGWVWKSITMTNVGTGFKLVPDSTSGAGGNIGSASFLDSSFSNVQTAVVISPPTDKPGSGTTGLALENIALSGVGAAVADTSGKTILAGGAGKIDQWHMGPVYSGSGGSPARTFSTGGKVGAYRRHSTLLDDSGGYFERAKPQYEDRGVGDFLHVKDMGARGDGVSDDTAAFQAALYAAVGKVLFIDAGSYILTSTVTIPSGSKIVGETWSQLAASGSYFTDPLNPKVMLKVGNPGDVGDVEMQDLFFTTVGPTAGAILVEWNLQAKSPGSAGLWDCHARVGGATGTKLTPAECPPATSGVDAGCSAASLMMHLTPTGSGYFENMWLWVSDHMIE